MVKKLKVLIHRYVKNSREVMRTVAEKEMYVERVRVEEV